MNNLIRKYDTGTDYQVYFMQSQTNRKFGIGNYNTKTNKMENLVWITNYNTALNEVRKRLKIFNGEEVIEEKKNQYTLDDFKKDGELKIKSGQSINDKLFYYLKNKMQPRSFGKKCFQPGIVVGKSIDNEDLYYTFVLKDEWVYIGLCAGNETTPKELMTENKKNDKMNKTIKLTESDFKSLIKESVNQILNELDWKTYTNAAKKRMQQNDYDNASKLADTATDKFNDEFGYTEDDNNLEYYNEKAKQDVNARIYTSGSGHVGMGSYTPHFSQMHSAKYFSPGNKNNTYTTYAKSKMIPSEKTKNAYNKAHDEMENYYNGNYKYIKNKGWENSK